MARARPVGRDMLDFVYSGGGTPFVPSTNAERWSIG